MGNTVKIDLAKLREKISGYYKELDERNGFAHEEIIQNIVNECIVKEEVVEHPKHYQGKNECIDVIKAMLTPEEYIGFLKGNSIKYRFRSNMKNGEEDVKKAEWYESRLIAEKADHLVIKQVKQDFGTVDDIIEFQEKLKKMI